jgi:hypothetical protein
MPRYGLPNPTKGVTNLSKGSKQDLRMTNPAQSKSSFSTPAAKVPKDVGLKPHRLGVKTQAVKVMGKSAMGK